MQYLNIFWVLGLFFLLSCGSRQAGDAEGERGRYVLWRLAETPKPVYKGCTDELIFRGHIDIPQFGTDRIFAYLVNQKGETAKHSVCVNESVSNCRISDSGIVLQIEEKKITYQMPAERREVYGEPCGILLRQKWEINDQGEELLIKVTVEVKLAEKSKKCKQLEDDVKKASPNHKGFAACEASVSTKAQFIGSYSP